MSTGPYTESPNAGNEWARIVRLDTQMNEETLVAEARAGSVEAFSRLIDRDGAVCYRLCFAILRSHADAQDAAQATFVKAWRQLPSLRDVSAWSDWLRRIAVRTAIDTARHNRPRMVWLADSDAAQADPSVALADRMELEAAFVRLSTDDRAVLTLRFYLDLELPQVAAALGVPLGTAKSRLHRALQRLRIALEAVP